jgi:hypothetical protein
LGVAIAEFPRYLLCPTINSDDIEDIDMGYTIQKGVPLPPPGRVPGPKGSSKYPWERMEIGDCFDPDVPLKSARVLASRRSKVDGRTYAVRRSMEDGAVRIWRTA